MTVDSIYSEMKTLAEYVIEKGSLEKGSQLVIGCSSSEILGGHIGKASSPEAGKAVASAVIDVCAEKGIIPEFQCCEHLNRALVMEEECALARNYMIVSAVPQIHAGGSLASAAYRLMKSPVLVWEVSADAGIDIGDTLIGMHLHKVAVPLRHEAIRKLGEANVVMAYTRPPYIGGERAKYSL
ncbi:MAG: TIGR01440 family protein [Eubacteriales bacterium]|nr:TIGR01440 family protein [Eubacteriales bacterium]MDD3882172.1 TIGR01440 family protein [Eubacteriales bacterium]MDD4513784.1 TIGR01440 family protein [Eubacteriales bacterium]